MIVMNPYLLPKRRSSAPPVPNNKDEGRSTVRLVNTRSLDASSASAVIIDREDHPQSNTIASSLDSRGRRDNIGDIIVTNSLVLPSEAFHTNKSSRESDIRKSCGNLVLTNDTTDGFLPLHSVRGYNVEKVNTKLRSIKAKKISHKANKEFTAHRSKSLTQIDCIESSPPSPMVKSDNLHPPRNESANDGSTHGAGLNLPGSGSGGTHQSAFCNSGLSSSPSYVTRPPAIRSNSSSSSLPVKDDKKERKISGSQRQRRGALMVSCENLLADSEMSVGHDGSLKGFKGRSHNNRKSGGIFFNPFKTEREKMEQLSELLNHYSQHGIPEQNGLLTFDSSDESGDLYYLEEHWKSIVADAEDLPKKMQNQNDAIWELLHTEVFYIRRLKVITDLFLSCLCNLQSQSILNEIDTSKMFSNIMDVYAVNYQFWTDHLLPMLNTARASHQSFNPLLMREGFLKFDQMFHPYMRYCLEHSTCLQYVKEKHKESEIFKTYVVWCETQKDCERLRLMDLLVKPMQRLTKYSLLLKAILKKTDSEEQKQALKQMNSSVEHFVCIVDSALRRQNEQEKLTTIVSRIESYDAIETNNEEVEKLLKEYIRLDLTCPMPGCSPQLIRQLFVEGSMKLKDSQASKIDVHCFLFTDILLICKPVNKKSGDRVKVIRQPFIIDRIVVQELKDGSGFIAVYLNEFRVASTVFVLHSSDTKIWIEYIKKAQEQYRAAKTLSQPPEPMEVTYFRTFDEDEDYDYPSMALLVASQNSPRSSSRSSLVHSHSGSVDMSDPVSSSSGAVVAPAPTPNLLPNPHYQQQQQQQPPRAVSFELGDLRNPSLTVEDLDAFGRSQSVENRTPPVCVTVTSPRPERRAFFLRNAKSGSGIGTYSNTLSVNVPYQSNTLPSPFPSSGSEHHHQRGETLSSLSSIQIPVIPSSLSLSPVIRPPARPPSPKALSRTLPLNSSKPPLVKTKNVMGLVMHSAPASEGPSPVHSFESEGSNEYGFIHYNEYEGLINHNQILSTEEQEALKSRLHQKRTCRAERRYHTADSIENMKKEKDASIHKRLSWNYGQQQQSQAQGNKGIPSHCERILCNKHFSKCLSSESVYSSSGFSSTGSVPLSVGSSECEQCGMEILDHIDELESSDSQTITQSEGEDCGSIGIEESLEPCTSTITSHEDHRQDDRQDDEQHSNAPLPGSNIKIDISEVRDGISSVQITVSGTNGGKPSKSDLTKMKEFLLTNYNVEASEV